MNDYCEDVVDLGISLRLERSGHAGVARSQTACGKIAICVDFDGQTFCIAVHWLAPDGSGCCCGYCQIRLTASSTTKNMNEINHRIKRCTKCPRLSAYIREVAKNKVRRFANEKYYGRPLPGFGDTRAELLIVGLAPAAHGGNRTGRMFTGDSSGDWLAAAMHKAGFASQPTSQASDDGLVLYNAYVTAAVRCAPPQNKPTRKEMENCSGFLEQEMEVLENVKVILCLGKIAYDSVCRILGTKPEKFGHNKVFECPSYTIVTSYHPSKQNTQTGRLSQTQWHAVFRNVQNLIK